MKSYILGYYAPSDHLLETLANEPRRRMLDSLLNSYPAPMNIKGIASNGKVSWKTVYGADYLGRMVQDGFVREVDEREETGGGSRYVLENVNSLSRTRHPKYSLAPGNVEYPEEFKNALNSLTDQTEIKTKFRILYEFVRYIVESVKESSIAPKEDNSHVCSTCGLNHEGRDFIRAALLYLVDRFERSSDYLEFLREKNYIDIKRYNEYLAETQSTPSELNAKQIAVEKTAQKELMKEQQSTHSMENEEQTVRYATPHKQHKTKRHHTEEWKLQNSLRMQEYRHLQEDIEKMRKYQIDDTAFDIISADAKYRIGYIVARGSIVKRRDSPTSPSIKISVLKEHFSHLERFKEFIKTDHPVSYHKKSMCAS
jgi:hypothetical protein